MRTIKFFGLAAALAVTAATTEAQQTNIPAGAFPALDRAAHRQAMRLERMHRMQEFRLARAERFAKDGAPRWAGARAGFRAGAGAGLRAGGRAGFRAGMRAGFHKGQRTGMRAGLRQRMANATPEQKALFEQWGKQRQDLRQQVLDGKLTREQARAQMQQWRAEHLPKK